MPDIYIIAEIAQAHDGSLGMAHAYIDALATTGVDAIKFQVHIAEAESSVYEHFRVKFSFQDKTRMDYWKRIEFTRDQWAELKRHCTSKKLDFIASPFSNTAVDLLQSIGVDKFKVASGEVSNKLLLKHLSGTGKEIFMSSGMSSMAELDDSVGFLMNRSTKLSLLQCTSAYPTHPSQWGLNLISHFRERYQIPVGFSDHSGDIFACLAAVSHGAELIEFHTVFDKRIFGPDTTSSITVDQAAMLVTGARQISQALQNPVDKNNLTDIIGIKQIFEKSLAVNQNLPAGHLLTFDDLEAKKPRDRGISADKYEQIIGRQLSRDLRQWEFLTWSDLLKNPSS